jgi:hypothetical protein
MGHNEDAISYDSWSSAEIMSERKLLVMYKPIFMYYVHRLWLLLFLKKLSFFVFVFAVLGLELRAYT